MATINPRGESVQLAENIEDRAFANELLKCGDQREHFWRCVIEIAMRHLPCPQPKEESFNDEKFEQKRFPPYGRIGWLAGKRVLDASTEEIARWLDDDEFTRELRRYAATPRFRERQRTEEAQRPEFLQE